MVKFTLAPVALVAFLAGAAFAQDVSSAVQSASSAVAPTLSSSASSAAPTSMSSSTMSSGGDSEGGSSSGVCTVLNGVDQVGGCTYSSTSTPPYDLNSLMSYLIGGYTRRPEAVEPSAVADQLAGSVIKYYPTLTMPRAELQSSFLAAIEASITAVRNGEATVDAAPAHIPASLVNLAVGAAAIAAAGAFVL